ncbi:MAG TPA: hypothetical protein VJA21_00680 [Verrucomicrobiae bacterium]
MPTAKPRQTIPAEAIRGYATLAPEFAQHSLNVVAHFCQMIVDHQNPHALLAPELGTQLSPAQLIGEFRAVFDEVGAWPQDYEFEGVVRVLCDDSVRKVGGEADAWPDYVTPLRWRVIIEFSWHFPPPHDPLRCRFWVSAQSQMLYVCKFAFHR